MKQFLVLGSINAVTYKEVFPYIKSNVVKYRPQRIHKFLNGAAAATWYTTLQIPELPFLELTNSYNPVDYPKYDNYNAIEVSRTKDIPMDYDGVMGVPITFLDKYCPEQFEIVDAREFGLTERTKNKSTYLIKDADSAINGKPTYARIAVKRKYKLFL